MTFSSSKYLFLSLIALIFSCNDLSESTISPQGKEQLRSNLSQLPAVAGRLHIKLRAEAAASTSALRAGGRFAPLATPTPLGKTLRQLGTYRMERVFAPSGPCEARTVRAGLDRWYTLYFDDNVSVAAAEQQLGKLEEVEVAERILPMELPKTLDAPLLDSPSTRSTTASELPFSDPELSKQWHYINDGSLSPRSKPGADINVLPVWQRYTTGAPNVIVAVIDGGIDVTHEDLVDNLYVNEAEKNGEAGKDDDGNGFVDDVHGYNFVDAKDIVPGKIEPDTDGHGTHVAGTVAARNNNGIGVCGVAGGNGQPNTGVRLMSCQMFRKEREEGDPAAALKYAADNGAVIAQCSWGYPFKERVQSLPQVLLDALDYFTTYAGCDPQTGLQKVGAPMKGGVVIFAAGNEDLHYDALPASLPSVIAVSATAWDFSKASYSNYGEWMDLAAPGGDISTFGNAAGVLSCVPKKSGQKTYVYKQGTSMACPHVSGVAALIASYYGQRPGFTAEMLKKRLLAAVKNRNIDEDNPTIEGKLGLGHLDALAAFADDQKQAPQATASLESLADYTTATITWPVSADADDEVAYIYHLYLSEKPLSESTLKSSPKHSCIKGAGHQVGERLSTTLRNLRDNTIYHLAIVASDRWGNISAPTFTTFHTRLNHAPSLQQSLSKEPLELVGDEVKHVLLSVADPDGHSWEATLAGERQGVSMKREGDKLKLSFRAVLPAGSYATKLVLTDQLGTQDTLSIPFNIQRYTKPALIMPFADIVIGLNEKEQHIALAPHYHFSPRTSHHYSLQNTVPSVASASVEMDNMLHLRPHRLGTTRINITASDGRNSTSEGTFQVRVVEDAQLPVYSVYPVPVRSALYALLNSQIEEATFVLRNTLGEEVYRSQAQTNAQHIATANLSTLPPGTYSLSVITKKGTHQQMILKR